jgi:hypothetical protein
MAVEVYKTNSLLSAAPLFQTRVLHVTSSSNQRVRFNFNHLGTRTTVLNYLGPPARRLSFSIRLVPNSLACTFSSFPPQLCHDFVAFVALGFGGRRWLKSDQGTISKNWRGFQLSKTSVSFFFYIRII